MQILKNQNILERQSDNYIQGEISNVASVLQTPQVMTDYFPINADHSMTMEGFNNVEDYISENSLVTYDEIENLMMSGIDNLVTQSQYDDELGFDEDLTSQGIIFPNTVMPKPYDCFLIKGARVEALYVVTTITPVTSRSNPFIEIQFRLFSRDAKVIEQLRKQVKTKYLETVTAIGMNKTMVITKESYFDVQKNVEQYMDIVDLYKTLFYDYRKSLFIYDGIYDSTEDKKKTFLDMTLWRLMFDEGLVVYDDIITYSNNNYKREVSPIFISCPDTYLDDHLYKRSIIWRLYSRDKKHQMDEFKYPQAQEPDSRVGKYTTGHDVIIFDYYGDACDCNLMCVTSPVFDNDFCNRIKNNLPYEITDTTTTSEIGTISGPSCLAEGASLTIHYNPYLRNAIIKWYNSEEIDWENLKLSDDKTTENFMLLPILLAAYKEFIKSLQK